MNEIDPAFRIISPEPPRSPEVKDFFVANPEFNVEKSLLFLAAHYPDSDSWVVDSGVAVQLLTGKRKLEPRDLDIVSQTDEMEDDFGHTNGLDPNDSRYIDVKSIKHWLSGRVPEVDEQTIWKYVIATSKFIEVSGLRVRVMHPALIAAGKSTLARMAQRPKDSSDIELLQVTPEQLDAATKLLQGQRPDEQLKRLY
ncbi:MAG: hypothetical protein WBP26_03715 [Candidatus Saccharimonadales bacterium]